MSVHVFTVNEENYQICVAKGIVGLPEAKESCRHDNVFDGLLSRISCIKENDYILMYVIGKKELRGVWQADGEAYYDVTEIWSDGVFPFRCKIKCCQYNFSNPLKLNDINAMRNNGKIWTWALQRASGSNAMFSISNQEFELLLNEYMKVNPFSIQKSYIPEPSPFHRNNIIDNLHIENNKPKYEYTVMSLLNQSFSKKEFTDIFGNYNDSLCYVPTNLGKEMDILLMFEHPINKNIISYDILEVKKDTFDTNALAQLIDYESWFLQKKIAGDYNMLRTTAIASVFSNDVVDYVTKRKSIEKKPIKLVEYNYINNKLKLNWINRNI